MTIDFEKHLVTLGEKEIHLTQIEFKIISLLAKNSGRVMTYDAIISNIWGPYADDDNSILRVNMALSLIHISCTAVVPDAVIAAPA